MLHLLKEEVMASEGDRLDVISKADERVQAVESLISTCEISILDHLLHEVAVLFETLALTEVFS